MEHLVEGDLETLLGDHAVDHAAAQLRVAVAQLLHRVAGDRAVGRDVLGQLLVVVHRAAGPHQRGDRGGETAAQRTQEGRQAGAGGDLVLLQVRQQNGQRRHEEQRHAQALQQLHHRHVVEVDLQVEVRAHEAGRAHHQEGRRGEQAQVHAGGVLAHEEGQQHRDHAQRRGGETGPGGGVAQVLLQPQRHQQGDREERGIAQHHRQRAGGEVAVTEQFQVHDRVGIGQLPDQEDRDRDRRDDAGDDDEVGVEPVRVVALVQHDLQRAHADDQGDQAHVVDARALGLLHLAAQLVGHHRAGEDADRQVDEEDPRPGIVLGDPATQDRPGDRRHHGHHRQQGQRHAALGRRVDADQQALRDRVHRAGHRALQRAEHQQHAHALRHAAHERGKHEQQRAGGEQAHFAEAAGEEAGQRQRDRHAHRERGDHPGALVVAHAEIAGDGRQRDVGDGGVQHLHEGGQRQADRAQCQIGWAELAAHRVRSVGGRRAPLPPGEGARRAGEGSGGAWRRGPCRTLSPAPLPGGEGRYRVIFRQPCWRG